MATPLQLHKKHNGKLNVEPAWGVRSGKDLALAYTPGVADVCKVIHKNKELARTHTIKGRTVAIISDGSAVLGLGNIGPEAAMPVMEGKAMLLKNFANINGFPVCIDTQDTKEIITFCRQIAPTFGAINLEDIAAPKCFEIEQSLQDLGIPVFHDDQHGTAIVVMAGLINAAKVVNKRFEDLRVVINGAGAAGTAIAKLLLCHESDRLCKPVANVIVCDSKGIIHKGRKDLNKFKNKLAKVTNKHNLQGRLAEAVKGADVFIGVSKGNIVSKEMVRDMHKDAIIFAMANPIPEIMPKDAKAAGAKVIATGRSDFPNQVNNVLAYPGIFKGALDARAGQITPEMKSSAAFALASLIKHPTPTHILPSAFDKGIVKTISRAVKNAAP